MPSSAHRSPNPQGKGLAPVLDNLRQIEKNLCVPPKDIERISNELFTSLFVLNSQIKFKPIVGRTYWLYRKNLDYRLSLISPGQWSPERYGRYIGACEMQTDLTWTLQLSEDSRQDRALIAEISALRGRFEKTLHQAERVDDMLPVYVKTLPFYSRVLASALAHSLQQSMQKGGISGLNFDQAQQMLRLSKPG